MTRPYNLYVSRSDMFNVCNRIRTPLRTTRDQAPPIGAHIDHKSTGTGRVPPCALDNVHTRWNCVWKFIETLIKLPSRRDRQKRRESTSRNNKNDNKVKKKMKID